MRFALLECHSVVLLKLYNCFCNVWGGGGNPLDSRAYASCVIYATPDIIPKLRLCFEEQVLNVLLIF